MSEEKLQMAVAKYLDHHPATKGHWFHPPNGGKRNVVTAAKLKAQGVKAGAPDVLIFRPIDEYWDEGDYKLDHLRRPGLAIELKVGRNKPTPAQLQWHDTLRSCWWRVEVCRTLDEVVELVRECYGG